MTRPRRRHGATTTTATADLEERLERVAAELAHAERELDTVTAERRAYRAALVRIANAKSGVWGTIAREALVPPLREAGEP